MLNLPTAIVPVRLEPTAKRRLAHVASPAERANIVWSLLDRVVAVLNGSGLRVVVLSPTPVYVEGAEVWTDRADGLNGALDAAIRETGCPALIVHADLPAIAPDDVHAVVESPADVVVARARDGGTNALLLRRYMRPSFGPRSALRHAIGARRAGLRVQVIDRPGLATDVDDEAALTSYRGAYRRPTP